MEGTANAAPAATNTAPNSGATKATTTSSPRTAVVSEGNAGLGQDHRGAVSKPASKQAGSPSDPEGLPSGDSKTPAVSQDGADPSHIWTVKVRGEERKFDIRDPEQAKYVRNQLQKVEGADKRLEQASLTEKQAKQFFEALKTNPGAVLQMMGHDLDELAKNRLAQKLRLEAMDPKDRAIMERDQRLAEYQKKEQEIETQKQAAQKAELENKFRVKWDQDITQALGQTSLPKSEYTVARTVQYILAAKKMDPTSKVEAADVVHLVENDYKRDIKSMFGSLPVEKMLEYAGEDILTKLRQYDLSKLTNPEKQTFAKKPSAQAPQKRDNRKKGTTWADYQKILEERVK